KMDIPVAFPPGGARLATSPSTTASKLTAKMMGISPVARLAALVVVVSPVTMTSRLSRTRSAASSGRRPAWPSGQRYSKTMSFPSTYPRSRSPSRNAGKPSEASGDAKWNTPILYTLARCCASVVGGAPSMFPTTMMMTARRSITQLLCRHPSRLLRHGGGYHNLEAEDEPDHPHGHLGKDGCRGVYPNA